MIDLKQMVERFLERAVAECRDELPKDKVVIHAIEDRNQSAEVRKNAVVKWLRAYGVFRGLNEVEPASVVNAILEFADARPTTSPTSEIEIIERFDDLYDRCKKSVRRNKDGTYRSLPSLTSKALWCCYPDAIPILDAYAERSLWIISRFMGFDPQTKNERYDLFVSVWLSLYRRVEHVMDADSVGDYPYKVKVLDRILWIIGQPYYGA